MVLPTDIAGAKGLFRKNAPGPMAPDQEMMGDIATMTRRLRVLEEQYTNVRRRISVMDQNMLSHGKRLKDEAKAFSEEIIELKKAVADIDEKLLLIIRELKRSASKEDVEVLKKYISIWEPINFVTRGEVEKIIADILDERSSHRSASK